MVDGSAQLHCSLGAMPSQFIPAGAQGSVNDVGITHIPSFGMCTSPANPDVAAATAAANGVVTPALCNPQIYAPWTPAADGSQVDGAAAIDAASTCACGWGGEITVG